MLETIMIGNLGADAKVIRNNGNEFVAFNVAHTDKYRNRDGQQVEETTWVSVAMDGNGGNLTQYLVKGKCVCIRGRMRAKVGNNGQVFFSMSNPRVELIGGGSGNNASASGVQSNNDNVPF